MSLGELRARCGLRWVETYTLVSWFVQKFPPGSPGAVPYMNLLGFLGLPWVDRRRVPR